MSKNAREVSEKIETCIRELGLKPGDRIPTEDHLMEKFRLTRHRVRAGIAFLQREKGFVTIKGSGTYIPGGSQTPKPKEKTIAVIDPCDIASKSKDLHVQAFEKGYHLLPINVSHENPGFERSCLESVMQRRLVAVCLEPFPIEPMNFDLVDQLIADGVKVLLMNAPPELRDKYSLFLLDYKKAGYMAVASMMGKGFRKIYFIRSFSKGWQHQDFADGANEAAKDYSLDVKIFRADTVSNPFPFGGDVTWSEKSEKIPLELNVGYISDTFPKGKLLYSDLIAAGIAEPPVFAVHKENIPSRFSYALLDPVARLSRMLSVAMDGRISSKKIVTEKFAPIIINPAEPLSSAVRKDANPLQAGSFHLVNAAR